jgi:hypothetical protein
LAADVAKESSSVTKMNNFLQMQFLYNYFCLIIPYFFGEETKETYIFTTINIFKLSGVISRQIPSPLSSSSPSAFPSPPTQTRKRKYVQSIAKVVSTCFAAAGGEFTKLKQSFKQRFETCVKKVRMK